MNLLFIKLGAAGILLAALVLGYFAWERHIRASERALVVAEYNAKITEQKAQATRLLAEITANVNTAEKTLRAELEKRNVTDTINEKTISVLADKLHTLVGRTGGVFVDPHATGCWQGGDCANAATNPVAGTGFNNPGKSTGVLSKQVTDDLLTLAREADDINAAYQSCRADAYTVRTKIP